MNAYLKKIASFYILIYICYRVTSVLYPGSPLSQILLFLFIVASTYFTVKLYISKEFEGYLKCLFLLVFLFTIYGCVYLLSPERYIITAGLIFKEIPKTAYLKNIYISLLPIFSFYYLTYHKIITENWIRRCCIFLLLLTLFLYYWKYNSFIADDIYGRTELTNNYGYAFLSLMPFIPFWNHKKIWQYILFFIILSYVIMAMKRGAIIIAIMCSIYYFYSTYNQIKGVKKIVFLLVIIFVGFIGLLLLESFISSSDYFQRKIERTLQGDTNSRDFLYTLAIRHFLEDTTFIQLLLGTGADSTIDILGNYAHNDWLEILINQGAIGVTIYFFYFRCLFGIWFNNKNIGNTKLIMGLCFIILFTSTLFSMSYASVDISIAMCLGYAIAQNHQKRDIGYKH